MTPMAMTSQPTFDWPSRADSDWAVTSDPMHSSDIRSKIIESDEEEDRVRAAAADLRPRTVHDLPRDVDPCG